ncbi:hypothetical protein BCR32DRAFT_277605 [Anaeromyces robustus]|uniref:Uncharacterized protein n=1 Tax=Anaeromyces robustus TaxID=1754192 RepID=A0A1Y1XEK7_9FUNG|nr:hypothetical protein BCR32DRAFT_277605 [Anaeromyces robustus]|eukprot:ORX83876.1 hypothetical protein BCR32DRAFT_277605 [Anaeromyces robustus]
MELQESKYEINNNSLNIPIDHLYNNPIIHKSELQSSNGHVNQPDINKAYFCKNDNCTSVYNEGYRDHYVMLPDDNGNIKTYIIYNCEQSCISKVDYNETHYISYKCTNNSDCLYDKCVNNFCTFNDKSSIEYCNNIYKYFSYFEYSYIHCGKAPGDTCNNNNECSSKKCEKNICETLQKYDIHDIRINQQVTTLIILIISKNNNSLYSCYGINYFNKFTSDIQITSYKLTKMVKCGSEYINNNALLFNVERSVPQFKYNQNTLLLLLIL